MRTLIGDIRRRWLKIHNIEDVIRVAENELGYTSKQDTKNLYDKTANSGINGFSKYFKELFPTDFHCPWCTAFICWCFKEAYGEEDGKLILCLDDGFTYIARVLRQAFRIYERRSLLPDIGSIMFVENDEGTCHVALVTAFNENSVTTISGNVLGEDGIGRVEEIIYDINDPRIFGYGSPRYGLET